MEDEDDDENKHESPNRQLTNTTDASLRLETGLIMPTAASSCPRSPLHLDATTKGAKRVESTTTRRKAAHPFYE